MPHVQVLAYCAARVPSDYRSLTGQVREERMGRSAQSIYGGSSKSRLLSRSQAAVRTVFRFRPPRRRGLYASGRLMVANWRCSVPTRPSVATQMIQSGGAVLDKGYGHHLRTTPGLASSGSLCIRYYQIDGVLVLGRNFSAISTKYENSQEDCQKSGPYVADFAT